MKKLLLSTLFLSSVLSSDILTRTDISFNMDDDGNLNPSIFVPFYYGSNNQFFSGVGYSSGNSQEVETVNNFSDSKNSYVSDYLSKGSGDEYPLLYLFIFSQLGLESLLFYAFSLVSLYWDSDNKNEYLPIFKPK